MINTLAERKQAKHLYFKGYSVAQISVQMGINQNTVQSWKAREKWDEAPLVKRVESAMEVRLCQLIDKEHKDNSDYKELDKLTALMERTAKINKYNESGNGKELNPNLSDRRKGKTNQAKNHLDDEAIEKLESAFFELIKDYQKVWFKAKKYRIRNLLKSRQIGATLYFALEAFIDAAKTGDNQIFLSASKAQAHIFRDYIIAFVKEVTGIELKGSPLVLSNGATMYFLGTNSKTAQGYHGHVYCDEYFWIHKFQEFRKVISGMAMHKKWRQTYISTPSFLSHDAYPFWSGELFNKGRKKENRIEVDISHQNLKNGKQCADGQWRQIVTVEDAIAGGADFFDLDELKLEYSDEEYANLLMCQFVDTNRSVFSLNDLMKCMVDSWEVWTDFDPLSTRPFGDRPVWVGYDPSRSKDDASLVVVAPPDRAGGKFRVLEDHSLNNADFDAQANFIKQITEKYNVEHLAIDASGIGMGVYELVKQFYPSVHKILYNIEVKTQLVLKAKQVISKGRLEFDAGSRDMAMAFMAIHQTTTASGLMTYAANRTDATGHADKAFALMHALIKEPLTSIEQTGRSQQSIVEIC